jgi:hydrogenase maturation factor
VFAQFEVPTPSNGWDVAIGIKTLRQQEVRVPAVATMSLAFQLDAVVRRGWFVQHNYIGRLNIRVSDNDTCVLKWVEMVGRAVAVEEKLQQKKEEQKILRAMKAMESEPEEVIYPDLSDWGDDQS